MDIDRVSTLPGQGVRAWRIPAVMQDGASDPDDPGDHAGGGLRCRGRAASPVGVDQAGARRR